MIHFKMSLSLVSKMKNAKRINTDPTLFWSYDSIWACKSNWTQGIRRGGASSSLQNEAVLTSK
jgi:hypothetical protein